MNVKELSEKLEKIPLDHEVRVSGHSSSFKTLYPLLGCEEAEIDGCEEYEEYCLITFYEGIVE